MSTESPLAEGSPADEAPEPTTGGPVVAVLLGLVAAVGLVLGAGLRRRRTRAQKIAQRGRRGAHRVAGKGSAGARNVAAALEHRASKTSGGVASASADALKKARRKAKKIKKRLT